MRKKNRERSEESFFFYSGSPTLVIAFLSITSKVVASALATRIFDITFYVSLNECHFYTLA
ncbi:hypothetical protein NMG60_11007099 [Bertholletia excelsa]